jgi:hypothetical protein
VAVQHARRAPPKAARSVLGGSRTETDRRSPSRRSQPAVDKWPACARLLAVAPAGHLSTAQPSTRQHPARFNRGWSGGRYWTRNGGRCSKRFDIELSGYLASTTHRPRQPPARVSARRFQSGRRHRGGIICSAVTQHHPDDPRQFVRQRDNYRVLVSSPKEGPPPRGRHMINERNQPVCSVVPNYDSEATQFHLDATATSCAPGAHAIILLDLAGREASRCCRSHQS